ncbi:MAG: hypothetical protein ACRCWF_01865 [Beijerinckiaceae bacterium]
MSFIGDFLSGKTHKLARDFLFSGAVIAIMCFVAVRYINEMVENVKLAQKQTLPQRVAAAQPRPDNEIRTITRSVLDDNVVTGSVASRRIILDPCTGKEK